MQAATRSRTAEVHRATSIDEAVTLLTQLDQAQVLAGGTWVMRAQARHSGPQHFVALKGIKDLHGVTYSDAAEIGALTTHSTLATQCQGASLMALRDAAHRSAFPQVRNVATIGGNLGAVGFAEADLVPALLASEASLQLHSTTGTAEEPLENFLATRGSRTGELIKQVRVPIPAGRVSAFERLTVRATGEYPIVNVAISADLDGDLVRDVRIAVGGVEAVAKLCADAASQLVGNRLDDEHATARAVDAACHELTPREGLDAPAWYRISVLPPLIRRALTRLNNLSQER